MDHKKFKIENYIQEIEVEVAQDLFAHWYKNIVYQGRKMDKNEELVNSPKKYTAHKSGL